MRTFFLSCTQLLHTAEKNKLVQLRLHLFQLRKIKSSWYNTLLKSNTHKHEKKLVCFALLSSPNHSTCPLINHAYFMTVSISIQDLPQNSSNGNKKAGGGEIVFWYSLSPSEEVQVRRGPKGKGPPFSAFSEFFGIWHEYRRSERCAAAVVVYVEYLIHSFSCGDFRILLLLYARRLSY